MEKLRYEDKFNIMIIGDEKIGKTSILERYFDKTFLNERKRTIGIEHYDKIIKIGDKNYLFKIWDTAGQEQFRTIGRTYYQKAHGMILTCAINNRKSFESLRVWLKALEDSTHIEKIQLIIIANKCDLETERKVTIDEIKQKASDLGIEYFQTSAKLGIGVEEAINNICLKIYQSIYSCRKSNVGIDLLDDRKSGIAN